MANRDVPITFVERIREKFKLEYKDMGPLIGRSEAFYKPLAKAGELHRSHEMAYRAWFINQCQEGLFETLLDGGDYQAGPQLPKWNTFKYLFKNLHDRKTNKIWPNDIIVNHDDQEVCLVITRLPGHDYYTLNQGLVDYVKGRNGGPFIGYKVHVCLCTGQNNSANEDEQEQFLIDLVSKGPDKLVNDTTIQAIEELLENSLPMKGDYGPYHKMSVHFKPLRIQEDGPTMIRVSKDSLIKLSNAIYDIADGITPKEEDKAA
jgi:hypothetical protein